MKEREIKKTIPSYILIKIREIMIILVIITPEELNQEIQIKKLRRSSN